MRLHRGVPIVAAVVSLAGVSTRAAYAFDSQAPGGGGQPTAALVQHPPSSSTDWLLIGVGSAGAITLAAAGVGATQRGRATATTAPSAYDPRAARDRGSPRPIRLATGRPDGR
jgi:hypothetical protein